MNRKYRKKAIKQKGGEKEKMKNGKSIAAIAIAAIMMISVMTVIVPTALGRVQFTYGDVLDETRKDDIYINGINLTNATNAADPDMATVRLYGEIDKQAPRVYSNYRDAFDPTIIPKDSATFNPAIIKDNDLDPRTSNSWTIKSGTESSPVDSHLKKYMRIWYEPQHAYEGPRTDSEVVTPTKADVIEIETTYMLVDAQNYKPISGEAGVIKLPFPTEGLGGKERGMENMTQTTIVYVAGDGTDGTVQIQRTVELHGGNSLDNSTDVFDHRVTFSEIVTVADVQYAKIKIEYIGNTYADAPLSNQKIDEISKVFYDRSHNSASTSDHTTCRTWYVKLDHFVDEPGSSGDMAALNIGKELSRGDVFYVDGLRYDVPAVYVKDGKFKYITIRTPLPKSDPIDDGTGNPKWTSVTPGGREELVWSNDSKSGREWQVVDNSKVTTQWIVNWDQHTTLPVNPPFNWEYDEDIGYAWRMVDDTDVQLWEINSDTTISPLKQNTFPWGPEQSGNGLPKYPEGERYLTDQNPPADWKTYFDVVEIDNDNDGEWIATDVSERLVDVDGPLVFNWTQEWYEYRYSTVLLEILNEYDSVQNWTKYDIKTMPDQYTTFVLPDMLNPVSELDAWLNTSKGSYNDNDTAGECERMNGTYRILGGDYLITTSFVLEDSGRLAFTHDPTDWTGIYMPSSKTVRLYGEIDKQAPRVYSNYRDAFDPTIIPKDSATFNPAIIKDNDLDPRTSNSWTIKSGTESSPVDSHLKKYMRIWYEPQHAYEGPRTDSEVVTPTKADVIEIETTYMLVDAQNYKPISGEAGVIKLPFPTEGLGGKERGMENMTQTTIVYVAGDGTDGTVQIQRTVELHGGNSLDNSTDVFDHRVTFSEIVTVADVQYAKIKIEYIGNTYADAPLSNQKIDEISKVFYDRSHNSASTSDHTTCRTWYVKLDHFVDEPGSSGDMAALNIGKELSRGDVFYVDGLRYDVPAVYVKDGKFKYITIRTPLPKSDPIDDGTGNPKWTSVTPGGREELVWSNDSKSGREWQVVDNSKVTTQWIVNWDQHTTLPVNPPFNWEYDEDIGYAWRMVDDTDVQLWEINSDTTISPLKQNTFPWGPEQSGNGLPKYPEGERYLTDQNPPADWKTYFDVVEIDNDNDGEWIATDVSERLVDVDGPLVFNWTQEWYEYRYSTVLLEILNEYDSVQNWTKYDIKTMPDQYTTFVLPDMLNPVSELDAWLNTSKGSYNDNDTAGECERMNGTYRILGGDYLITTSLSLLETDEVVLESVTVSPSSAELNVSDPQDFTAEALYSNSSTPVDVTTAATWESTNETVGTVGEHTGSFIALAEGDTTVQATYTYNSTTKTGTAAVTVTVGDVTCPWDLTSDGTVNIDDVLELVGHWGEDWSPGDFNDDNNINIDDVIILVTHWGACP